MHDLRNTETRPLHLQVKHLRRGKRAYDRVAPKRYGLPSRSVPCRSPAGRRRRVRDISAIIDYACCAL